MTLRYLFHSGFLLETAQCLLVFDYWMDPADVMSGYMNTCKHVYVFSSHFHEDHFTKEILKWKNHIPNITYILSKDILKRRRTQKEDADVWMVKGAVWEDENLKVTATGSNDSGVSWIVETEGKTIFHAGDLCNWYARFLVDGTPEGEIISEESARTTSSTPILLDLFTDHEAFEAQHKAEEEAHAKERRMQETQ